MSREWVVKSSLKRSNSLFCHCNQAVQNVRSASKQPTASKAHTLSTRAREGPFSHRRVVREARHHDRIDHQITGQDTVVKVHVEVVASGSVVDPVLDELEPGQPDPEEREVVGSGVTELRDRLHA